MALARPQPQAASRGLQIWLIVAFAVAVIFAAVFFIQLADQSKLGQARQDAEASLAKVLSNNERSSLGRFYEPADTRKTMAGLMNEEIQGLAKVATGAGTDEQATLVAVREKTNTLLKAVKATDGLPDPTVFEGANLHDAARTLHGLYVEGLKANAKLTQQNEQLTGENQALNGKLKEASTTFADGAEKMKNGVAQLETERNKSRQDKDAEVKDFEKLVAQSQQEREAGERRLNNRITELEGDLGARDKAIAVLQSKIDELVGPAVDAEAVAIDPDGQIIQASPTDTLVYISLGKKNNLTLGITFVVFTPPIPGQPREKSKGIIEVAGIFDNTAECRIVKEDEANPIVEGDLIANAIYDPNRKLRFTIAGQFDLDHDGRDDVDGYDRIAALIQQWGGQLVDTLDERIDFVVIGTRPPVLGLPDDASPEQQERQKEQQADEKKFLALKNEAKALSIPMLTQEQFLRFIGQHQKQSVGNLRAASR